MQTKMGDFSIFMLSGAYERARVAVSFTGQRDARFYDWTKNTSASYAPLWAAMRRWSDEAADIGSGWRPDALVGPHDCSDAQFRIFHLERVQDFVFSDHLAW